MVNGNTLHTLSTPCLVLDEVKMHANIARLHARVRSLGVGLRAHVKTCKSIPIAERMGTLPHAPITVSTLQEAERFFAAGYRDVLYAVGIAPGKLDHVLDLRARGCDLMVVVDSVDGARVVADRGASVPTLIEIDSDDHRAGVRPHDQALLTIANTLRQGAVLRGVMTHAGASYGCRSSAAIVAMAEQERGAVVEAARRLQANGSATPIVSVGSTPTVMFAEHLTGVSEVRAGVFVFMDLVMVGLAVCTLADVALSVLVTVIGHQRQKNLLLTDGGWMALSRDHGTEQHAVDQRYGLVCDVAGQPFADLIVTDTNQEHGILARRDGGPIDWNAFPVGTLLRVLPNHACATAAQHDRYHVVRNDRNAVTTWPRFGGW